MFFSSSASCSAPQCASAEPVYTVAWEVSGLLDDAGRGIRNLAFDIDFGKEFFRVSRHLPDRRRRDPVDGPRGPCGSGYVAPAGIVIDLHIRAAPFGHPV
ncbi:MAG: hypothetical protein MZV70_28550 [Desulfobacterales bacterium]|nr:hypothetical protein [Desulfobacterales bacterium]